MTVLPSVTLEDYAAKLAEWENTPYRNTTMQCGFGVDCVRFVVAIVDWLHGFQTECMPDVPVLPPQTSTHQPTLAWSVVRWLLQRYPQHETVWTPESDMFPVIEPGDIFCIRTEENPGHAMIAGPKRNVLWHSMNSIHMRKVHPIALSWCFMPKHELLRVWRLTAMRLAK